MNELKWVEIARKEIGVKEIKGRKHNPRILEYWNTAFSAIGQKPWYRDDETPWCGGFIGYVMAEAGLKHHIPKMFPRAAEWLNVGTYLHKPAYGCIVVFSRRGGGHVGIVVGQDKYGNLMVLGGNQGDMVSIKPFAKWRVTGYRWCGTMLNPGSWRYKLPILSSDGKVSTNEA